MREWQCAAIQLVMLAVSTQVVAQAVAVPETGDSDAGIGSRAIVNVASNDTINGVPATLGSPGNAKLTQLAAATGLVLNPTNGAVTVAKTVPAGSYQLSYQICDKNDAGDCSSTTDTVNVINAVIDPQADIGTTVRVGKAARPIASVVSNDTVNGAPAVLGSAGNATIAALNNPWPTGITLNTSTGAVTTSATTPADTYNLSYNLCDRNVPTPTCAPGQVSFKVVATILPMPLSGSTFVGQGGTAIANVVINDVVNGARAILGSSGNATVATLGDNWSGFTLDPDTGALSVSSSVAVGQYTLGRQLCDRNTPANCNQTFENVYVTPPPAEVQASVTVLGDIEFDWGRDGLDCPTCNDGDGNSRFNWTDRNSNLWVNHIDPTTGQFVPDTGHQERVDTNAFFWKTFGNGPEWAFSMPSGSSDPVSGLVYTRWEPGTSATLANAGAALATQSSGEWTPNFFPGAMSVGGNTILPFPSQCRTDPVAMAVYNSSRNQAFVEDVSADPGTQPILTNFGPIDNPIGTRWVACTHWLTFQGTASGDPDQQVFWYNADTNTTAQLTFDETSKSRALMFESPELLSQGAQYPYMLVTLATATLIQAYTQTGVNQDGSPIFTLYNTIHSPDPTQPYFFSPKVFVHCTPTCHTWMIIGMSKTVDSQFSQAAPNGLGLTNFDPANPVFKVLVSGSKTPLMQRQDPEYFITSNGPYVYYAQLYAKTASQPYQVNGFWYMDLGLGPASGPCVGSSAEDGLYGPVGICQ